MTYTVSINSSRCVKAQHAHPQEDVLGTRLLRLSRQTRVWRRFHISRLQCCLPLLHLPGARQIRKMFLLEIRTAVQLT